MLKKEEREKRANEKVGFPHDFIFMTFFAASFLESF